MNWRELLSWLGLKSIKKGKREHFYYGSFTGIMVKKKDGTEIIVSLEAILRILFFVIFFVFTLFYGMKLGAEFQQKVDSCMSFQKMLWHVETPQERINQEISILIRNLTTNEKYGLENKTIK